MNYQEVIEFIHSIPWMGKKLGLSQVRELLAMMGNPQNGLKFIHVAGTNGKGSICEMTARILEAAGYRTGFFVSPYIHRFNERMQVNHEPISDGALVTLIEPIKKLAEKMEVMPSEFEVVTAAAFQFFADEKCDYVVLEVGMGGRLDATNVIDTPLAAVIATIGLDHTKHLGNTIREIAFEKAGIIKRGGDAVIYGQRGEAEEVFREVCHERSARLTVSDFSKIEFLGEDGEFQYFSYKDSGRLALSLKGEHQLRNAATVLETVGILREKGAEISDDAVRVGLSLARWPGRFETLSENPRFVVDGGHNPEGARAAVETVKRLYPGQRAVVLLGMTDGKDAAGVIEILDEIAGRYVVIQADNARALSKQALLEETVKTGKPAETADTVSDGIEKALALLEPGQLALAVGSLYTVGEIRGFFKKD